MIKAYKDNNKSSMFQSGSSEDFKSRTWDALGVITSAMDAAEEQAVKTRTDQRQAEEIRLAKRARLSLATMGLVAANENIVAHERQLRFRVRDD